MAKKMSFKLKTKLYFISIGMVALFSAVVLFQFNQGLKDQRKGKIDGFNLYYENLSSTLSQLFYAKYNNIQAFARNKDLKDKNKDGTEFLLNELTTLFPDMDYLVLADLDGNIISHNTIDANGKKLNYEFLKGYSFADKEWFKRTKDGEYVENLKKKIFGAYVSEMHVSDIATKLYGKKRMGQYFSTLIEDEYGDPIAVLGTFINARWVENEMAGLYEVLASNGMPSAEIHLFNKKGQPISFFGEYGSSKESKVVHDFDNYNLKKNYFEVDNNVTKALAKSESGTVITQDFVGHNEEHIFAYGPIKNRRFLEELGWSLVVGMQPSDAFSEIIALQKIFYITLAIAFVVCCVVSVFIVSKLYTQLINVIEGLRASAGRTFEFVSQLNDMSGKVNEMSSSQASAIQETASTLDEVSQMVKMSAQNADNSVNISTKSESNATSGKEVVLDVVSAMNDIKDSNEEILKTTSEGNQKINEIVSVINEISEKTKVINDIVFQTKLLSFNASVEAARAGEHGKGFAVVAEEVGNLAQMSGKAAEEIGEILTESVNRVETIVKENQGAIEKIMHKSKEKIEEGIEITGKCTSALEEIVEGVKVVSSMSREISTASKEQESGVTNISMAMNQLQDTTNENSNIAFQTLKCSEQLDKETEYLKEVILTLESEVVGGKVDSSKIKKVDKVKAAPVALNESKEANKNTPKLTYQEDKKKVSSSSSSRKSNVVQMPTKKSAPVKTASSKADVTDLKTAVGGEIPDANDPRFEDI